MMRRNKTICDLAEKSFTKQRKKLKTKSVVNKDHLLKQRVVKDQAKVKISISWNGEEIDDLDKEKMDGKKDCPPAPLHPIDWDNLSMT